MSEANKREASYILGHSEAEILRLQAQAKNLRPITRIIRLRSWQTTVALGELRFSRKLSEVLVDDFNRRLVAPIMHSRSQQENVMSLTISTGNSATTPVAAISFPLRMILVSAHGSLSLKFFGLKPAEEL